MSSRRDASDVMAGVRVKVQLCRNGLSRRRASESSTAREAVADVYHQDS